MVATLAETINGRLQCKKNTDTITIDSASFLESLNDLCEPERAASHLPVQHQTELCDFRLDYLPVSLNLCAIRKNTRPHLKKSLYH